MNGRFGSLTGAGLFTAAMAWAFHQQAGYLFASWSCSRAPVGIWITGAIALLILSVGMVLSNLARHSAVAVEMARPRRFLGLISLMATALFLFALLLQAAAALFLPGCAG